MTIGAATYVECFSLRLFVVVVGGEHIAMAMVVVGHICTQSIMVVNNIMYLA